MSEIALTSEIAGVVDAVLDHVEFTKPVELEDVLAVHDAIVNGLPVGARLESYHRHHEVYFEVRVASEVVIRRHKAVIEAP